MKTSFIKKWTTVIMGILLLALSLNLFLDPHKLTIGGATGIAVIVKNIFGIPLSVTNLIINIPLLIIAIKIRGFSFVKDTIISTILLSIFLEITIFLPPVETDIILSAIFGGLLSGAGIGLILKGDTTTGGGELLTLIIHHYYSYISPAIIMLVLDCAVVAMGIFTLGVTPSLYAIVAIYVMSRIVNIVLDGLDFKKAVFITSQNCSIIGIALTSRLERGATYIDCQGMYSKEDMGMLLIVVTPRQISKLKEIVKSIDENAFVIVTDVREIQGNFRK